ncbi:hypothetical protein DSECCO2_214030 [anaerobic digester metagenome]
MAEVFSIAALNRFPVFQFVLKQFSHVSQDGACDQHIHIYRQVIAEEKVHLVSAVFCDMNHRTLVIHKGNLKVGTGEQGEWNAVQISRGKHTFLKRQRPGVGGGFAQSGIINPFQFGPKFLRLSDEFRFDLRGHSCLFFG